MLALNKGDLVVRIIDVGNLYYCNIIDKTNNISSIKILDIVFNLDEDKQLKNRIGEIGPYKTRFRVDNRFFNNVKNKLVKFIEISIKKGLSNKIEVIYTKKENDEIVFTNDSYSQNNENNKKNETTSNDQTLETFNINYENTIREDKHNYTDLPKETPKIEVPNNISEINKLKVDNYKLAKEVKSLKESLEKVTQSKFGQNELVNSLKEEIQKLESEKRDIDYELSSIKRKYEEINKNYEDLEKISKTKDEQVYNLKSALSNYETENTLLKDELKKKIEELNKLKNENSNVNSTNRMNDIILKQINDNVNRLISYQFANTGDGTLHITKLNEVIKELLQTVQAIETKLLQ